MNETSILEESESLITIYRISYLCMVYLNNSH